MSFAVVDFDSSGKMEVDWPEETLRDPRMIPDMGAAITAAAREIAATYCRWSGEGNERLVEDLAGVIERHLGVAV